MVMARRERPDVPEVGADGAELAAALAGDPEAFRLVAQKHTRELQTHCYRMLGSFHDAEDGVQETLLRAWRHRGKFEHRSSFRAWLYRIATNVCLQQRSHRVRQEPLPEPLVPNTNDAITGGPEHVINLSPYPDALLDELEAPSGDPVVAYDLRESVQLAFLAAMQLLPPRQRAVLILHDVVGFPAAEVAELLDSTVASVNSALNRARIRLEQERAAGRLRIGLSVPSEHVAESLVQRCIEAWQAADIGELAGLLKRDVVMGVPALRLRYVGRESVSRFLATVPPQEQRSNFRFLPTRANRQPALAVYRRDPDSDSQIYRAWAILVLTTDGEAVAGITAFIDPSLMPAFGLPTELESESDALQVTIIDAV
jgi:RNA polymerase sigma-70 factor (TIGR02960 family)